MNHRLACLVVAGLALTSAPHFRTSASARYPTQNVEILVGGSPERQYAHQGRWYIQALKGREYAIRLHNPYGVRVAIALSVDGLNTIDARQTSASEARKWVLAPHETVTISGWQTSQAEARRFEFTTEERSYGQALGKTTNLGVISAAFFRERAPIIQSRESARDSASQAAAAPSAARNREAQGSAKRAEEAEYAATGMGRRTDHLVTQVWLDLEEAPAHTVNIRYEFRTQLVKLGIIPATSTTPNELDRRERARGFEPGFAPVPRSLR